mmetsp:Transcript_24227/g.38166  ORF Transcript_24227/g.38166 Transcript_24227/m.38166 type:complete len:220 (-) Transcript_24227:555-1214(-)
MKRPPSNYQPLSLGLAPGFGGWTFDSLSDNILAPRRDEKIGANYSPIATGVMPPSVGSVPSTVSASVTLTSGSENRERESKKRNIEVTESKESEPDGIYYKGHKYIGPTKDNRPQYKAKQEWEWNIYPHGVSKQGDRLRVQIKQKGANPTYPQFDNTYMNLLQAALFRDQEAIRLLNTGVLVRMPKLNFLHPDYKTKPRVVHPTKEHSRSKNLKRRRSC